MLIIFRWLKPQQRQLKPILPRGLPMASPRIAPRLGKNRHNLIRKIDRPIFPRARKRRGGKQSENRNQQLSHHSINLCILTSDF